MLTDLNFKKNAEKTLWKNVDERIAAIVRSAVSKAFKNNLPVLSVRGLEEFGLWKRYAKFILLPPDQLYRRSTQRAWCFSPWQTVPISVRGEVTICDCRPDASIGNILNQPLADIWNGPAMIEHRSRMLGPDPPEACRACPRF
jgi:radical SAM protein with 4Fe4S-binding SPASM domain